MASADRHDWEAVIFQDFHSAMDRMRERFAEVVEAGIEEGSFRCENMREASRVSVRCKLPASLPADMLVRHMYQPAANGSRAMARVVERDPGGVTVVCSPSDDLVARPLAKALRPIATAVLVRCQEKARHADCYCMVSGHVSAAGSTRTLHFLFSREELDAISPGLTASTVSVACAYAADVQVSERTCGEILVIVNGGGDCLSPL
jgi:hypothetical protein